MPVILLVGGTGDLGGRVAQRLARRGLPFRALVRPRSDAAGLLELGAEVVRGDLTDRGSLDGAVAGVATVISSAHSLDRIMSGRKDVSIRSVDLEGNANLVDAAQAAGVSRFVFVSFPASVLDSGTPFARAKLATEDRLRRSSMREVIVRPDAYQEPWLSGARLFDWTRGSVTILGRGDGVAAYVAMDDVAEALVRLATLADPPCVLEFGGPEALTRNELADALERGLGRPLRRRHVPRAMLRLGAVLLRPFFPGLASVMGMGLFADRRTGAMDDGPLRDLGIEARPVSAYIAEILAGRDASGS